VQLGALGIAGVVPDVGPALSGEASAWSETSAAGARASWVSRCYGSNALVKPCA